MSVNNRKLENSDRPELHYTPPHGWMNDPNGLLYHNNTYHMYYQYDPNNTTPVSLHWGHAVSTDLIRWEHRKVAICPDEKGMIYSGSLVVDHENVTGFRKKDNPPLVAAFTYHKPVGDSYCQSQGIAYSIDNGETFTKFEGNPVLDYSLPDFRDPKLIYLPEKKQWIMPLVAGQKALFYSSGDLKSWDYLSTFTVKRELKDCLWECPDLFPIHADDGTEHWILMTSVISKDGCYGIRYFVGTFDGTHFIREEPDEKVNMLEFGYDNYAAVTFSGIKDRTIIIGWMNCWYYARQIPAKEYRGSMTIPRELQLLKTADGYSLAQTPVRELFHEFRKRYLFENVQTVPLDNQAAYLILRMPNQSTVIEFLAGDTKLELIVDMDARIITVDRRGCGYAEMGEGFHRTFSAPLLTEDPCVSIQILLDKNSMELFTDRGQTVCTVQYFVESQFSELRSSEMLHSVEIALREEKGEA